MYYKGRDAYTESCLPNFILIRIGLLDLNCNGNFSKLIKSFWLYKNVYTIFRTQDIKLFIFYLKYSWGDIRILNILSTI
jgi:hypothetical protein